MCSKKAIKSTSISKEKAWNKFVEGDTTMFKEVFSLYYKAMYGYGFKLCNQPELVRDCIQELFENIWERRNDLTHIESANVYLFVSLRRKILKKIKDTKKIRRTEENKIDEAISIHFSKEELIIGDEVRFQQKERLQKALNQLSDRQKEVIYLHFYNGMSYGEIENILSIKRQSVRNHMYRAMETLRSLLDNEVMKLVISLFISLLLFS